MAFNNSANHSLESPVMISSMVFACLYSFVFLAGLLLNSMTVWVFFLIRMQKRTFMLYLRNMAVADLLMTLILPINVLTEAKVAPLWLQGVSCRYTAVLFYCCMYANILFLGLVALDRYLKIVRPFGGSCGACLYSYSFTVAMAVMVWLAMMALSLPNTILTSEPTPETVSNCTELKSEIGIIWHGVVIYINTLIFFLVLVTLLMCYVSLYRHIRLSSAKFVIVGETAPREAKGGQNILVLLVVFFICFVPYHLCRIPFTKSQINGVQIDPTLLNGKKATLFLSTCNVCLDPVIYFFMCRSFRRKLIQTLKLWTLSKKFSAYFSTPERKNTIVKRFKEECPSP